MLRNKWKLGYCVVVLGAIVAINPNQHPISIAMAFATVKVGILG